MFSLISIVSRRCYCYCQISRINVKPFHTKVESQFNPRSFQKRNAFSFGQPVVSTHPHLLLPGEIMPGIKLEEVKSRRQKLVELIMNDVYKTYGKMMYILVVIPSASKIYMVEKIPYVFRQNTDFLYLSGCLEPDTALILRGKNAEDYVSTIFVRPADFHAQLWDGPRTGVDDAVQLFGVDEAFDTTELSKFLARTAEEKPDYLLFYDSHSASQSPVHNAISSHIQKYNIKWYRNSTTFLHQLRVIKSAAEQSLMRKAGEISSLAMNKAIQTSQPEVTEHQLFALVDYVSRMNGAETLAYVPVVACGRNATIIHYIDNKQMLKSGELVLMDAGCEYHGYCGDISRTWPVDGKFNKYQRILYEIILDIQMQLISMCTERPSMDDIYMRMMELLGSRLQEEKIISGNIINSGGINAIAHELCPHHSSHYLGMDLHDVACINKNIPLKPGMVITIEPGLYIKDTCMFVAPEFRNLGIRIEDDILITSTDIEVLSSTCLKTVNDIENLMKNLIEDT